MKVLQQGGRPIKAWIDGVQLESQAEQQLYNVAAMPFVFKHVAAMPDVHWGFGATVGSVIPTKGAVIPAAVGVDIGCGMNAVKTTLKASDLPDSLVALRHQIERDVPVGFNKHKRPVAYAQLPIFHGLGIPLLLEESLKIKDLQELRCQLGTLGGGNHFIEVCLDENQDVWIMLHSGSRGIGNKIGSHFIALAKRDMEQYFITLPDKDLAYFSEGTPNFTAYIQAMSWAQEYALENRRVMMQLVVAAMRRLFPTFELADEAINCHHNYCTMENHFGSNVYLTRKGAVRARKDDLGVIPGSMGTRSYIVRGLGNADSFNSCSHGAGRAMSRTEAGKRFTLADHAAATAGVECRKDKGVIDETPGAYKDIDAVMEAQKDLVEIVHTLKQVLCVKG